MKRFIFQAVVLLFSAQLFFSCDELSLPPLGGGELTTAEIVEGLKTALVAGADSSTANLSKLNGYYNDLTTRIPLPNEVNTMMENIKRIEEIPLISKNFPNLTSDMDEKIIDLAKAINASAGEAAKEAFPIFKNAITDLSITDGLSLLQGKTVLKSTEFDSTAATKYLKAQTIGNLTELYAPKMNTALGKPFVGDMSATKIWNDVTGYYNSVVNNSIVQAATSFEPITTDLGQFVTEKALDGLFLKVGEEEKQIRKNPLQYASDIIQKVFGAIF